MKVVRGFIGNRANREERGKGECKITSRPKASMDSGSLALFLCCEVSERSRAAAPIGYKVL